MKLAVADWRRERESKKEKKKDNPSAEVYAGDVLTRSHVMCYSHPSSNQLATILLLSFPSLFITGEEGTQMKCQSCFHMQMASHHITVSSTSKAGQTYRSATIHASCRGRVRDTQLLVSPCCNTHIHMLGLCASKVASHMKSAELRVCRGGEEKEAASQPSRSAGPPCQALRETSR